MSSRVTLHHTPAGTLGLILPVAALALLGVVALAQRTPNPSISLGQSESEIVAAKIAAADPMVQPKSEPTLCYPEAAVDPHELHRHQVASAHALALKLEQRAAAAPDGTTSISVSDLRMLRSALMATHSVLNTP